MSISRNIKKIIHISYECLPYYWGGIGVIVHNLAEAIKNYSCIVVMPADVNTNNAIKTNYESIKIPGTFDFDTGKVDFLKFIFETRSFLAEKKLFENKSVLFNIHDPELICIFPLASLMKDQIVCTFHREKKINSNNAKLLRKYTCLSIFVGYDLKKAFRKYHCYKKNVTILNGLDNNIDIVNDYKEKSKKIRIGYCGRFEKEKGFDRFVKIIDKYKNDSKKEFVIAGKGSMENTLSRYHKYKNIKFIGFLNYQEMDNFYDNIDILFVPSRKESFGLVILEALVRGKKIIASDLKGLKKIYSNCQSLVFVNFKKFIKQDIQKLLDDITKNNSKLSEEDFYRFSTKRMASEYEKVYERIWKHF